MTLPLLNTPHLLAPDDVFGKDLANLRHTRMADVRLHVREEHTGGESGAGEHDTVQIARSVFVFKMPKYDPTADRYGDDVGMGSGDGHGYGGDLSLRAYGPAAGWSMAPVLRSDSLTEGGTSETIFYIDCVPDGELCGTDFCPIFDDAPAWTEAQMHVLVARKRFERLAGPGGGGGGVGVPMGAPAVLGARIYLGSWDAIKYLVGGTIVCHCTTRRA